MFDLKSFVAVDAGPDCAPSTIAVKAQEPIPKAIQRFHFMVVLSRKD